MSAFTVTFGNDFSTKKSNIVAKKIKETVVFSDVVVERKADPYKFIKEANERLKCGESVFRKQKVAG